MPETMSAPSGTKSIVSSLDADSLKEIVEISGRFITEETIVEVEQMNAGYINRSYRICTESPSGVRWYTLQRINDNVFRDVGALMDNFILVTDHLRDRLVLPGKRPGLSCVQNLRFTADGSRFLTDKTGFWRMMDHFSEAYSMIIPDSPQTFYQAGLAFGSFLREMSDISPDDVKVVIPNFHNTRSRYIDLEKAIADDSVGRVAECEREIAFIRSRSERFGLISDALESGRIPLRVCHNDCNLNNILFDEKSRLPIAIIDLDTTMPSSPLYDYGDSMRIGTNTAEDDEKDLSKVSCDLSLYESYASGYLEACGHLLTREELELLPISSLIITSEDGIRFLADHINGDTYYTISYSGQNLDRSRTQLRLVEDMEKKLPRIREILKKLYDRFGLEADPFKVSF